MNKYCVLFACAPSCLQPTIVWPHQHLQYSNGDIRDTKAIICNIAIIHCIVKFPLNLSITVLSSSLSQNATSKRRVSTNWSYWRKKRRDVYTIVTNIRFWNASCMQDTGRKQEAKKSIRNNYRWYTTYIMECYHFGHSAWSQKGGGNKQNKHTNTDLLPVNEWRGIAMRAVCHANEAENRWGTDRNRLWNPFSIIVVVVVVRGGLGRFEWRARVIFFKCNASERDWSVNLLIANGL